MGWTSGNTINRSYGEDGANKEVRIGDIVLCRNALCVVLRRHGALVSNTVQLWKIVTRSDPSPPPATFYPLAGKTKLVKACYKELEWSDYAKWYQPSLCLCLSLSLSLSLSLLLPVQPLC